MNYKESDLIVRLISAGKNTYKDLRTALPHIKFKTWATMGHPEKMSSDDVACLDKKINYVDALIGKYSPNDTDTFHLTLAGENRLYELNLHDKEEALSKKAVQLSEEANKLSETANKKAEVSNTIATISLITALLSLLYTIFGK